MGKEPSINDVRICGSFPLSIHPIAQAGHIAKGAHPASLGHFSHEIQI